MSKYKIRDLSYFDVIRGKPVERYGLYRGTTTFWRKRKVWQPVFAGLVKGDAEWAKRVAKHYGIKLPPRIDPNPTTKPKGGKK